MEIKVYFGTGEGVNLDKQKPLQQVNDIEKFIAKGENFSIVSCSPYIIEAINAFGKKANITYFNNGIESKLITILDEISEAFYKIQDYENI